MHWVSFTCEKHKPKKVDQTLVDIGKLYLEPNDILLQEAIIEGERPGMIIKNDTIEYNVSSYKVSENAVVKDLLKKYQVWKQVKMKKILLMEKK